MDGLDTYAVCRQLIAARAEIGTGDRAAVIRYACHALDLDAPDSATLARMVAFRRDDLDVVQHIAAVQRRRALDRIAEIAAQRAARAN